MPFTTIPRDFRRLPKDLDPLDPPAVSKTDHRVQREYAAERNRNGEPICTESQVYLGPPSAIFTTTVCLADKGEYDGGCGAFARGVQSIFMKYPQKRREGVIVSLHSLVQILLLGG